jgi:hypothetical protein
MNADPRYVEARRVLLNALDALQAHGAAVIVAGAQAVYLRTGASELGIAPYTTDGDIALDPSLLGDDPALEDAMRGAGFRLWEPRPEATEPGIWVAEVVIDGEVVTITAEVAGEAALFVAKLHKIHDRLAEPARRRVDDKDAADVYRLMQTTRAEKVAETMTSLRGHPTAGSPTDAALDLLADLFGRPNGDGVLAAARALRLAIPEAQVRALSVAYVERLLAMSR